MQSNILSIMLVIRNAVSSSTSTSTTKTTSVSNLHGVKNSTLICTCHGCPFQNKDNVRGVVKRHNGIYDCYVLMNEKNFPKDSPKQLPATNNTDLLTEILKLLMIDHEQFFVTDDHKLSSGQIFLNPQMSHQNMSVINNWIKTLPHEMTSNINAHPDAVGRAECLIFQMYPTPHLSYQCTGFVNEHSNGYRFALSTEPFDVYNVNGVKIASMSPSGAKNLIPTIANILFLFLLAKHI